ncbi:MAG TPA: metallophosphoesterase [Anaerolineales bacterium]|nr:metallophosphoesterase [Anaerolineales bacterium]
MSLCFFASDLHGSLSRYQTLFSIIEREQPEAVFLGGDLLPSHLISFASESDAFRRFVQEVLMRGFEEVRETLGAKYPQIFIILGNDDPRSVEGSLIEGENRHLWVYIPGRRVDFQHFPVYGYAFVPPTPFLLKDWEKYDVSRHVEPGCISPEDGWRSVPVDENRIKFTTIQADLDDLVGNENLSEAVLLFHTPPYKTTLDRAALDGKSVDGMPLDVHVGSIAVRRLIEKRQPLITLHGHIHESPRLTGVWKERIGRTWIFSAAHDGPELALVRFDLETPEQATRELI